MFYLEEIGCQGGFSMNKKRQTTFFLHRGAWDININIKTILSGLYKDNLIAFVKNSQMILGPLPRCHITILGLNAKLIKAINHKTIVTNYHKFY